MKNATFHFERLGRIKSFVYVSFIIFFLFSFHVILVYYIKNVFGFSINSIPYLIIKMWKELIVGCCIVTYVLHSIIRGKLTQKISVLDNFILLYVFIGLVYLLISDNLLLALWSFRSLFEIFLFYFFGRIVAFNLRDFGLFSKLIVLTGMVTAVFGVIQVEYLGVDFFYDIYGVEEIAVALTSYDYDKVRASSTFITPHEFGLYLVICLFLLAFNFLSDADIRIHKWHYLIIAIVLLTGILYTLSRSSFLILCISFGFLALRNWKLLVFFLLLGLLSYFALGTLGILSNLMSIFDGTDPSSSGRFVVLSEAISYYSTHPMGSGLGTVGVIVKRFNEDAPQFEGEIFNIMAQMGPLGLLSHLSIYAIVIGKSLTLINNINVSRSIKALGSLILLITFALFLRELILPRDFTNYVLGWFLIGAFISFINFSTIKVKTL